MRQKIKSRTIEANFTARPIMIKKIASIKIVQVLKSIKKQKIVQNLQSSRRYSYKT